MNRARMTEIGSLRLKRPLTVQKKLRISRTDRYDVLKPDSLPAK